MDTVRFAAALRELAAAVEAPQGAAPAGAPAGVELEYMTPAEYAARVRVSPRTIRRLINEEGMPTARVGRVIRLRVKDADAWLALRNSGELARKSAVAVASKGSIQ